MLLRNIHTFLALAIITCAKPIFHSNLVIHERRDSLPNGFTVKGPAVNTTALRLRVALTSNNMDGLEAAVYKNAYRGNGVFKDHLTKSEVESFVSPAEETTTKVTEWLSSNGVNFTTASPAGDWLQINLDVATANQLLDANFMLFSDDSTGKEVIRTLSYSIPAALQAHIQLIHPAVTFPIKARSPSLKFKPKVVTSKVDTNITPRAVPSVCNVNEVDPACLSAFYGIPLTTTAQTASRIAVAEFIDQFPQKADLSTFLKDFTPSNSSTASFSLQTIDGGSDPQSRNDSGIEADANVEYTVGLAASVPVTVISVGEDNTDDLDGFIDLTEFLLSETSPQQVLLITFGFNEEDVSFSLAQTLCNNYMQLAARGVSVIVAVGDGGVSGAEGGTCTQFVPTFPATCPFVTSVGATQGFDPEVPLSSNSGGFSNIFPVPSYQRTAVSKYLQTLGSTNAGLFNKSGRGFPDVSAQGANIPIVVGGEEGTAVGTPLSATIFASIIALLNAEFIASGNPPLGLLNPLIYEFTSAFNDITSGDNPGCGTNGFPAVVGWDPISGVGTPNFAALARTEGF